MSLKCLWKSSELRGTKTFSRWQEKSFSPDVRTWCEAGLWVGESTLSPGDGAESLSGGLRAVPMAPRGTVMGGDPPGKRRRALPHTVYNSEVQSLQLSEHAGYLVTFDSGRLELFLVHHPNTLTRTEEY